MLLSLCIKSQFCNSLSTDIKLQVKFRLEKFFRNSKIYGAPKGVLRCSTPTEECITWNKICTHQQIIDFSEKISLNLGHFMFVSFRTFFAFDVFYVFFSAMLDDCIVRRIFANRWLFSSSDLCPVYLRMCCSSQVCVVKCVTYCSAQQHHHHLDVFLSLARS